MDYFVRTKKDRSDGSGRIVTPVLAVFKGVEDVRPLSEKKQKKFVKKQLNKQELKLNSEKFVLRKNEEVALMPLNKIREDFQLAQPSVFEDTWIQMTIPKKVYKRWYRENETVLRKRGEWPDGVN